MRPLKAVKDTIKTLFDDLYVIPEYQRPYRWKVDQCEQLWDDIREFNDSQGAGEDEYFLGCITVYEAKDEEGNEALFVIDGQQRLITLSLLIKALYEIATENQGLLACLCQSDINTRKIDKTKPRIKSKVLTKGLAKDSEDFKKIIIENQLVGNTKLGRNYSRLKERIDEWRQQDPNNPERMSQLVTTLLRRIQVLRIKADGEDDAIQIFQTINDRGMALDATDIFKAELCRKNSTDEDKEQFINDWGNLNDPNFLFTIYMRILRAQKGDPDTRNTRLRNFFLGKDSKIFDNPITVMQDINRIHDIRQGNWNLSKNVMQWWRVTEQFPHDWWQYPIYVFLFSNMQKELELEDDNWDVSSIENEFSDLLKETLRYLVIRGINYRSVDRVKSTILNVCVDIARGGRDYSTTYQAEIDKEGDIKRFKESINDHHSFGDYRRILVYLNSILFEEECKSDMSFYDKVDRPKIEIEHILPHQWNHYDEWDEDSHEENINKLGNLMLLTKKVNVKASNEFFERKKKIYKDPEKHPNQFLEALHIADSKSTNWGPSELNKRDKEVKDRLLKFLRIE